MVGPVARADVRTDTPSTTERASTEVGLAVRVVDDAGRAIAGAEVFYGSATGVAPEIARRMKASPDQAIDRGRVFREHGESLYGDADGWVHLPHSTPTPELHGYSGGRYGSLVLAPTQPSRLVLRPDVNLDVRALGPDRSPFAGVDVFAALATGPGVGAQAVPLGTTSSTGQLLLFHLQERFTPTLGVTLWAQRGEDPGPSRWVDFATSPSARIDLQVAAYGSLTIHLVDHQGLPLPVPLSSRRDDRSLSLQTRTAGLRLREQTRQEPRRVGGHTTLRFDRVPLGHSFALHGTPIPLQPESFGGPSSAQPDATVTLRESTPASLFTGRALGPDGRPLVSKTLELNLPTLGEIEGVSFSSWSTLGSAPIHLPWRLQTDSTGRFVLRTAPGEPMDVMLGDSSRDLLCFFRLPRNAGPNDLGDLRFTARAEREGTGK